MWNKQSGIYIVENLINGKAYIGQAVDMQRRLHNHFVGRRSNVILQRAIKKYGIECFSFRFLEILPNDSAILTSCEQKWIDYYMSLNMSYNICPVAESVKGRIVTEQARKNMSIAQTGKKYSQETRDKIRNAKLGKSNNVVSVAPEDVTARTTEVTNPKDEINDSGGRVLSKAEALPLKEFQDTYGYSHHMQVLSKVKSGELKSFKDADDKTFIYHYDE